MDSDGLDVRGMTCEWWTYSQPFTKTCLWVRNDLVCMPLPRHRLVNDERPGAYHVISRCVRRAFLCGDQAEHRREWVRDLIRQAVASFAIDVLSTNRGP